MLRVTPIAKCLKQLQDHRPEVRMEALQALQQLQETKEDITPAFSPLGQLLASEIPEERWSAAEILTAFTAKANLGQWGYYSSAIPRLKKGDVQDKVSAANWLANITEPDMVRDRDERDIEFAIPALAAAIADPSPDVGVAALEAISAAVGDDQNVAFSMPAVLAALERGADPVRRMAGIVLRGFTMKGYDLGGEIPRLWKYLTDANDAVKMGIADTLTYYYAVRKQWTEVERLLAHPDKDVRQEAAGTLAHGYDIKLPEILPALKLLLSDPVEEVRLVAARTLARGAQTPEDLALTLPIIIKMLDHAQDETRLYAANVLQDYLYRLSEKPGKEGYPPATSPLWQPLRECLPAIQSHLTDKNTRLRLILAKVLARYYVCQDLGDPLVQMLQGLSEDEVRGVLNALHLRDDNPPKPKALVEWVKLQDRTRIVNRCRQAAAKGETQLNLSSQHLSAVPFFELPSEIGLVTTLTRLDVGYNLIRELPLEIGNLTNLETFICTSCRLESLSPSIGRLTRLDSLYLYENRLQDLPPEFGKLRRLKFLQLIGNLLEELPPEFGQLETLAFVEMQRNRLRTLPAEIGQLKNLKQLDVRENKLTDLPPELANLTNLESISLSSNAMRAIPPVIFKMKALKSLAFSSNNLEEIPPEIGKLKTLETLSVSHNRLRTLPPEIGLLSNLEYIDASSNQITALPVEIKRLRKLRWLDLHSNKLDIPETLARQCTRHAAILKHCFNENESRAT